MPGQKVFFARTVEKTGKTINVFYRFAGNGSATFHKCIKAKY